MRSRNFQRRPATVVSIMRGTPIRGILSLLLNLMIPKGYSIWEVPDSYYLMVEWTNPETPGRVTGRTQKMNGRCPYKVGDTVSILIHPDIREVWLEEQPAT